MNGERANSNTWGDSVIVNDPRIDHDDPVLREAAEAIHRNESLHRHNPAGVVCVYCAYTAANAVRATRPRIEALEAEVERLRGQERAVLDCINIYGDEILHSALDGIGYLPRTTGSHGDG